MHSTDLMQVKDKPSGILYFGRLKDNAATLHRDAMNKDQTEGRWDRFTAQVKQQWGDLTDDEIKKAEGNMDELMARIQEKYGDSREAVAQKFNEMKEKMDK